ncbi:hypothetical protein [Chryseolinea sp. H1M3-3]|uniref:hypothetical protein n=1 Tax=Chryseolinea sp. H1M3-3 TaxID=3034144 RepID=UPI0023ECC054|nr:hypothetical protein [Chryseolinea sp. H1M3-3]
MKPSIRQKLLIALGISAGLLASFNLFAQAPATAHLYTINSQAEYTTAVESIQDLATKLHEAHVKYPTLGYTHIYNNDGSLMGFNITGVPQSAEADKISLCLVQLELLGNAISKMDHAYLPESENSKLSSRVSKKRAMQIVVVEEATENSAMVPASTNPNELLAAAK